MNGTEPTTEALEMRCDCGQLMARLGANGVELKCKRCKRVHVIPWDTVSMQELP